MSSSVNILAPTEILSNSVYFDAFEKDKVRIVCNVCTKTPATCFFEGDDWAHLDMDWLGMAIKHLIAEHPAVLA